MKQILIIIFYLISNLSSACSCSEVPPMEKSLDEADIVFTGKVLSKESMSKKDGPVSEYLLTQVKYKVLVTTRHKGRVKNEILTVITGPALGGDCGYFFQIGKTYTIYAHYHPVVINGKEVNKFITTNICTLTHKYDEGKFQKIREYCKSKGYS